MSAVIDEGTAAERALSGTRETAVLLHCTGGSGAQWRALAASLRDRFHVLATDLYGYGGSGAWPGDACASLAAEGELVAAQLEASHGPVHLVGHSFGGAVALRLDDIGTLAMPTLVIRGARSPRPSRLIAEHVARVLPRAGPDTIEGVGHMAPITHAEMINARVVAHLVRRAQRVPT